MFLFNIYCRLWDILLRYEPSLSAGMSSEHKEKTSFNYRKTNEENDDRNGKFRGLQSQGNSESDNLMVMEIFVVYFPSSVI